LLKSTDFKALSIGVLIYIFSTIALSLLLASLLAAIFINLTEQLEWVSAFLINSISILCAGYYAYKLTRPGLRDHSLLLGIIIFIYLAIGTVSQLFDPEGESFWLNMTYDCSTLLLAYLGGRLARRSLSRKAATNNITG
jgi:hypothetical protein